jgi:hypothetical protein
MLCHAFADRVECHDHGRPVTIAPDGVDLGDRIAFLRALHEQLVHHFENCGARHVAIEYQNLGMAKKKVNRQVGEVTAVIVGAAIHAGASVEQS